MNINERKARIAELTETINDLMSQPGAVERFHSRLRSLQNELNQHQTALHLQEADELVNVMHTKKAQERKTREEAEALRSVRNARVQESRDALVNEIGLFYWGFVGVPHMRDRQRIGEAHARKLIERRNAGKELTFESRYTDTVTGRSFLIVTENGKSYVDYDFSADSDSGESESA